MCTSNITQISLFALIIFLFESAATDLCIQRPPSSAADYASLSSSAVGRTHDRRPASDPEPRVASACRLEFGPSSSPSLPPSPQPFTESVSLGTTSVIGKTLLSPASCHGPVRPWPGLPESRPSILYIFHSSSIVTCGLIAPTPYVRSCRNALRFFCVSRSGLQTKHFTTPCPFLFVSGVSVWSWREERTGDFTCHFFIFLSCRF